jgi:chorismate mutase / prephenate dehydratase
VSGDDPGSGAPVDPEAAEELERVRDHIDELDRQIVALLNERAALGRAAGRAKAAAGRSDILDAEREREVLLRVAMANPGPLTQADLIGLYRQIMTITRDLEHRDREAHVEE